MPKIDFQQVKQQFPLRDFVRRELGEPRKSRSRYDMYLSQRRAEKHPSLIIYDSGFQDFGDPEFSGGDVMDWVSVTRGLSTYESAEMLLGATPLPVISTPKTQKTQRPNYMLQMDKVLAMYNRINEGAPYFRSRAISDSVMHDALLGVHYRNHRYVTAGGDVYVFSLKWYSIPHLVTTPEGKKVRHIKYRLDPDTALNTLKKLKEEDRSTFVAIREDLMAKDPASGKDNKIAVSLFLQGMDIESNYGGEWGSTIGVYTPDVIVEWHGKEWRKKKLSYVMLVEAEFSALALRSAGVHAISVSTKKENYGVMLENVGVVYTAFDADEAGDRRTEMVVESIGWQKHADIRMPKGFKDPNEVAQAGKLESWLRPYGLIV